MSALCKVEGVKRNFSSLEENKKVLYLVFIATYIIWHITKFHWSNTFLHSLLSVLHQIICSQTEGLNFGWPFAEPGAGLHGPYGSLSTQDIQWFDDFFLQRNKIIYAKISNKRTNIAASHFLYIVSYNKWLYKCPSQVTRTQSINSCNIWSFHSIPFFKL